MDTSPKTLCSTDFSSALSATAFTEITELDGMNSCGFDLRALLGAGIVSLVAVVQTSLNQGGSWIDIIRKTFTASDDYTPNLTVNASWDQSSTPMVQDGIRDGVLGDRLRAVLTATVTNSANSSFVITAHPRV